MFMFGFGKQIGKTNALLKSFFFARDRNFSVSLPHRANMRERACVLDQLTHFEFCFYGEKLLFPEVQT